MTGTQWALVVLGGVIGAMLYRLVRWAISGALARKSAPGQRPAGQAHPRQPPQAPCPAHRCRECRRQRRMVVAGGSSGHAYRFLVDLEHAGLVTSEWDQTVPAHTCWRADPRRRFYRLTPEGREAAMGALQGLKEGAGQP